MLARKLLLLGGGSGVRNLLVNARWAGGNPPTSWTAPINTGSRTISASTIDPSDNAIRFQATNQRPYLQQLFSIAAGTVLYASFDVEAVTDAGNCLWSSIFNFSNVNVAYEMISPGGSISDVVSGAPQRVVIKCTFAASDTYQFRIGIGTASNRNGDITISRPMFSRSPAGIYLRS